MFKKFFWKLRFFFPRKSENLELWINLYFIWKGLFKAGVSAWSPVSLFRTKENGAFSWLRATECSVRDACASDLARVGANFETTQTIPSFIRANIWKQRGASAYKTSCPSLLFVYSDSLRILKQPKHPTAYWHCVDRTVHLLVPFFFFLNHVTSFVAVKMVEMPLGGQGLGAHLTFSSGSDSCWDQRMLLAFRTSGHLNMWDVHTLNPSAFRVLWLGRHCIRGAGICKASPSSFSLGVTLVALVL